MDDLVSPEYREQLQLLHKQQLWGASGYSHAQTVRTFASEIGANTVLDFGCGRGTLASPLSRLGIKRGCIYEYDPGIDGKDRKPKPADLLVATDVLEHVEPDRLDMTLRYIRGLTIKGAFFIIAMTPAKVYLPDGRNAHLIIMGRQFWIDKLFEHGFTVLRAENRKGLWVWTR